MSRDDDTAFEPRLGRSRGRGDGRARRPLTFLQEVNRAVARAGGDPRRLGRSRSTPRTGRFNARGRGAKVAASFPREHGWSLTEGGMRFRARRVVVKARVVKLRGAGSKAALAHLRYLQRDGATLDGERGRLYSSFQDDADGSKFLDRGEDDRHQFRLIVAPEDGPELGDLRDVTRRLMAQMERDLQTQLDWVAVDHHNTGHPHSHIVVRGVTDDGKILNIAGDYIAHGIRHRAAEIVTLELGMQSEWEVQQKLGREVDQDRFTRLDRAILDEVNEQGLVDLRIGEAQSHLGQANRYLLIERLKKLERMELAHEEAPARWSLSDRMEQTLRELGERGDIIKTMHRAITERGLVSDERSPFSNGGFGREAMDAMARRRQWLIEQGFAREEPDRIIYRRSMLAELARRELDEAGRKLAQERGGTFYVPESGERISGTYRQSVQLTSGKYALVERSREFTLVPWRPVIEKELGKQVAGLIRGDGISWELGRQRGLGIGM